MARTALFPRRELSSPPKPQADTASTRARRDHCQASALAWTQAAALSHNPGYALKPATASYQLVPRASYSFVPASALCQLQLRTSQCLVPATFSYQLAPRASYSLHSLQHPSHPHPSRA